MANALGVLVLFVLLIGAGIVCVGLGVLVATLVGLLKAVWSLEKDNG